MEHYEWILMEGAAYQVLPPKTPNGRWVANVHLYLKAGSRLEEVLYAESEEKVTDLVHTMTALHRGYDYDQITCRHCNNTWSVRLEAIYDENPRISEPSDEQMVCSVCGKYADQDYGPES